MAPWEADQASQGRWGGGALGRRSMGKPSNWGFLNLVTQHHWPPYLMKVSLPFWAQLLSLWPCPRSKNRGTIWGAFPGCRGANNTITGIKEGWKWHIQWSPAKDNSFEPQRNPLGKAQSLGEQNILCCSFEMVPTQFPQSHALNSFSILTFPYNFVSREILSSQHPGISFPKIQLQSPFKWFFKKIIIHFLKVLHCIDKFHN